jgi:hypothetical protein
VTLSVFTKSLAIALVAIALFMIFSELAEAHRTGSYHWHYWNDVWGCVYKTLYYPSGGSTGISQFIEC